MRLLFSNEGGLDKKQIENRVETELQLEKQGSGRKTDKLKQAVLAAIAEKIKEYDEMNPERKLHTIYEMHLMNNIVLVKNEPLKLAFLKILLVYLCLDKDNKNMFAYKTSFFPLEAQVWKEMKEKYGEANKIHNAW